MKMLPGYTLEYWKTIGGYLSIVKIKNRWYYIGDSASQLLAFEQAAKDKGHKLWRTPGAPAVVQKAWNKHGATRGALKKELPEYKPELIPEVK